jgi:hypothetical protein
MTGTELAVEILLVSACFLLIITLELWRAIFRFHKAKIQLLEESLRIAALEQLTRWKPEWMKEVSSSDVVLTAQRWIESAKKKLFGPEASPRSNKGAA